MSYVTTILADSPQGFWELNETSGTVAADAGSGANNGTYVNSPTLGVAALAEGTAVSLAAASNQEITLPNNLLDVTGTIELWFKWTSGVALMRDATGTNGWIIGFDSSGTFAVRVGGSIASAGTTISTSKTTAQVRDGNRHHLVVSKNGANCTVYLDKVSIGTTASAVSHQSTTPWHVGRNGTVGGPQSSDMVVDAIAIYPTALTSTQVAAHYDASAASPTYVDSGSGGFTLSGTSSDQRIATDSGSGGLTLSGSDTEARVYPDTGSGGFTLSGTADEVYGQGDLGSGGFTLDGSASDLAVYGDSGSGGFTLDGSGTDVYSVGTTPTPAPIGGLFWQITGLWYPGAETVDYYGHIADPQDGEVRIPLNDSRTAKVTVSINDTNTVQAILGHTYARCFRVYYHGTCIFWGPITLADVDLDAGTITFSAVDPSIRLINHFLRRGDLAGALSASNHDRSTVTVDAAGMRLLRDAGKNTTEQTTRGVPDLGINDGGNDFVAAPDSLMGVARWDQVWSTMQELSNAQGPDFELEPIDDTVGAYCQLNTYTKQGTDVSSAVQFHYGFGKDNLDDLKWTEGSKYVTHVHVLDRDQTYRVTPAVASTSADTGPYVQVEITDFDAHGIPKAKAEAVLTAYGDDILAAYSPPLIEATLTLPIETDSAFRYLRDFVVGDVVGVAGKKGAAQLAEGGYRIVEVALGQEGDHIRPELSVIPPQNPTINTEG